MKKIFASFISCIILITSIVPTVFAATSDAENAARALNQLGLFQGTGTNPDGTPNYNLDRAPTRAEAITMLVRLLGKESEAKAGTWTIPFTDVAEWARPYVGYAYTNRLTSGTSATTFGGEINITAAQYLTLVLRSLGYQDGIDFQWDEAWKLSDKIGLTDGRYSTDTVIFTRGDIAIISLKKLSTKQKDSQSVESPKPSVYSEGEYRVGLDIPAGEYCFTPKSDSRPGYYCAYSDTTKKDIVHNDNFKGTAYYTVTNGQLLRVNAATFELISPSNPKPTESDIQSVPSGIKYYAGTTIPTFPSIISYYGNRTPAETVGVKGDVDTYEYYNVRESEPSLYRDILLSEFGFSVDTKDDNFLYAPNGDMVLITFLSIPQRNKLFIFVDTPPRNS